MRRGVVVAMVMTGALLSPAAGYAQVSCTREGLQRAADLYVAAQSKGETSRLPLAAGLAMGVATIGELPAGGVDTEEDLAHANARWNELSALGPDA